MPPALHVGNVLIPEALGNVKVGNNDVHEIWVGGIKIWDVGDFPSITDVTVLASGLQTTVTFSENVTGTVAGWSYTRNAGAPIAYTSVASGNGTTVWTLNHPQIFQFDAIVITYNEPTGDAVDDQSNRLPSYSAAVDANNSTVPDVGGTAPDKAILPYPADGATGVSATGLVLSWLDGSLPLVLQDTFTGALDTQLSGKFPDIGPAAWLTWVGTTGSWKLDGAGRTRITSADEYLTVDAGVAPVNTPIQVRATFRFDGTIGNAQASLYARMTGVNPSPDHSVARFTSNSMFDFFADGGSRGGIAGAYNTGTDYQFSLTDDGAGAVAELVGFGTVGPHAYTDGNANTFVGISGVASGGTRYVDNLTVQDLS